MSTLPQIDPEQIEQKLLARNAEQVQQIVRLEVLAEALRDERDNARLERDHYAAKLEERDEDTLEGTTEDSGGK